MRRVWRWARPLSVLIVVPLLAVDRALLSANLMLWREKLFVAMAKMAVKASHFFRIPTNRVVELGTQVKL